MSSPTPMQTADEPKTMKTNRFNTPILTLSAFVLVYCLALGFGWLRQTPSQEELYGDVGRL